MDERASLSFSAVLIASLTLCFPALGAETSAGAPGVPAAEHQAAKKAAAAPVAPRPAAADDPYRCRPSEDVACTVVRETAQGTLIVTMRPARHSAVAPAWVVISGSPPSAGPHPGGTVYVVPNSPADGQTVPHQAALIPPNGAPILD